MAIHITNLNGGAITIGASGGGSSGHAETRFTLQGGTDESENITGSLDKQWLNANGYYDVENDEWLKIITQADIGNTVTSIGTEAFLGCINMTSLVISNSVTTIGSFAFSDCFGLTSVTINNGVQNIYGSAFSGCSGLTSVTIPASVTYIGEMAFSECSHLTSITVLGKTTAQAQTLLANADAPGGCTITGELG